MANCTQSLNLLHMTLYLWEGFVGGFHSNVTVLLSQTLNKIVYQTLSECSLHNRTKSSVTVQSLLIRFPWALPASEVFVWVSPILSLPTHNVCWQDTSPADRALHFTASAFNRRYTVFSCSSYCCRWEFTAMIKFDGMIIYGNHD